MHTFGPAGGTRALHIYYEDYCKYTGGGNDHYSIMIIVVKDTNNIDRFVIDKCF